MSNAPAPPDSIRRVVVASFIGTAIEWYDFFLYGTAATLAVRVDGHLKKMGFNSLEAMDRANRCHRNYFPSRPLRRHLRTDRETVV